MKLLGALERLPLASRWIASWMIDRHQRALARLLALLPATPRRVLVVGGGLFPRTPVALHRLLPAARIVVLDAEPRHIERAREWLVAHGISDADFEFVGGRFEAGALPDARFDAVIAPLAFEGDRDALYGHRGEAAMLVHDWFWRRRGRAGTLVSLLCLKRLNLV